MNNIEAYHYVILSTAIGTCLTAIAMPFLLRLCRKKGFLDMPGGRKVHSNAIPRLGGILFLPVMIVGVALSLLTYSQENEGLFLIKASSIMLAVGTFLIYIIGAIDDLIGMKANHKFIIQLIAALLMPLCGLYINNFYGLFGLHELPLWFSYPFTVFVILLIVNAINLIDGIDGLASGLCICILAIYIYLYLQMDHTLIYSVGGAGLLGALVAFFCFNVWGQANKGTKTFMGDSGSLFLGYALSYLSIKYAMDNPNVLPYREDGLLVPLTLLFIPIFDLARVAIARLYHKKGMFEPDKTHIHHVIMAAGFSMRMTLCIILALFASFCVINYSMNVADINITWILFTDLLIFGVVIAYFQRRIKTKK